MLAVGFSAVAEAFGVCSASIFRLGIGAVVGAIAAGDGTAITVGVGIAAFEGATTTLDAAGVSSDGTGLTSGVGIVAFEGGITTLDAAGVSSDGTGLTAGVGTSTGF